MLICRLVELAWRRDSIIIMRQEPAMELIYSIEIAIKMWHARASIACIPTVSQRRFECRL